MLAKSKKMVASEDELSRGILYFINVCLFLNFHIFFVISDGPSQKRSQGRNLGGFGR